MNKAWLILLLVLVAAGAFFLGRRSSEPAVPEPATIPAASVPAPTSAESSSAPEPVRTFRGPDGRAHIIGYDEKHLPDSNDPEQVRKALLSDMKWFPTNIEQSYDLSAEDVKAILAGTKPIPDYMLPAPATPAKQP